MNPRDLAGNAEEEEEEEEEEENDLVSLPLKRCSPSPAVHTCPATAEDKQILTLCTSQEST